MVEVAVGRGRQDRLRSRDLEDVGELSGAVPGQEGIHDRAEALDRDRRGDGLALVRELDGDDVAFAYTATMEMGGEPEGGLEELGPGCRPTPAGIDDGEAVGSASCVGSDVLEERGLVPETRLAPCACAFGGGSRPGARRIRVLHNRRRFYQSSGRARTEGT